MADFAASAWTGRNELTRADGSPHWHRNFVVFGCGLRFGNRYSNGRLWFRWVWMNRMRPVIAATQRTQQDMKG